MAAIKLVQGALSDTAQKKKLNTVQCERFVGVPKRRSARIGARMMATWQASTREAESGQSLVFIGTSSTNVEQLSS